MRRARVTSLLVGIGYVPFLSFNALLLLVMWGLHLNDLGKFYYDARAFVDGQTMYDVSPATKIPLRGGGTKQFFNLNPPHMHLVLVPFARLGPLPMFVVWLSSGLICLGATIWWSLRETGSMPEADTLVYAGLPLVASVAFGSILHTGQLTMHLLPLIAWAWIASRRGRWAQTGLALGLLFSFKPFFLLFLPWLAVRGRASTAGLSLLVATLCFAVGVAVFGIENHSAWLSRLGSIDWQEMSLNASLYGFVKRTFQDTLYFEAILHAPHVVFPLWVAGFVVIGSVSLAVAAIDRSAEAVDRSFVLLVLAAILMSPLGWIYYLPLALPPAIGLVRQRASTIDGWLGRRLRTAALSLAAVLVFIPSFLLHWGQPSAPLTVSLASAHFWLVFSCWFATLADGLLVMKEGALRPRNVLRALLKPMRPS